MQLPRLIPPQERSSTRSPFWGIGDRLHRFWKSASGQADKLRTRADALQGEVAKIADAIRNHPDHEDELIEELKLRIAKVMSSMLCGLLGIVIAAAHCPQHLPLRADRFGLVDAASSRNVMIGPIAIVNRILQGRADHKVMPSWDPDGGEEDTSGRTLYVFLVRSPSDPIEVIEQQKALEAHLADFHHALEKLPPMDPRFAQCTDFDACAKEMYSSYDLAATQAAVVAAINSLDPADAYCASPIPFTGLSRCSSPRRRPLGPAPARRWCRRRSSTCPSRCGARPA